jgi:hypothetical protein
MLTMILRLRPTTLAAFLLLSLLVAPRESRAQLADSARIAVGTPVWVRMRDGTQGEWRFAHASPESLTVRRRVHAGGVIRTIPWTDAERLDTMAVGPASGRQMLVGGASGGLLALLVVWFGAGLTASKHPHEECAGCGFVLMAPEIISIGIFTGATFGYFEREKHWSTAWRAPKS